jgi:hypothetical protein
MTANTENEEILLLLQTFYRYGVKYLLVGGFAVNRYGYKRTTGDIDIYLQDSKENRANLILALAEMGYGQFDMLMEVPIIAGYCEIMLDNGLYADLMTNIPGLQQSEFDEYYNKATIDQLGDYEIRFLHYQHLIQNKEATHRSKDLLDVEELKRIRKGYDDSVEKV